MIVAHDLLIAVADGLEGEPFLTLSGKPVEPDAVDEPEGTLVKKFSKTVCLTMAKELRELHKQLQGEGSEAPNHPDFEEIGKIYDQARTMLKEFHAKANPETVAAITLQTKVYMLCNFMTYQVRDEDEEE